MLLIMWIREDAMYQSSIRKYGIDSEVKALIGGLMHCKEKNYSYTKDFLESTTPKMELYKFLQKNDIKLYMFKSSKRSKKSFEYFLTLVYDTSETLIKYSFLIVNYGDNIVILPGFTHDNENNNGLLSKKSLDNLASNYLIDIPKG